MSILQLHMLIKSLIKGHFLISHQATGKSPLSSLVLLSTNLKTPATYGTITLRLPLRSVNRTVRQSHSLCYNKEGDSGFVPVPLSKCHLSWATSMGKNGQLLFRRLGLSLYGQEGFSKHPVSCAEEWEQCQCHQTNSQAVLRGRHQLCHSWPRERGCTVRSTFRRVCSIRLILPL